MISILDMKQTTQIRKLKELVINNATNDLDVKELSKVRFIDLDFTFNPTKILIRNASKGKKPRYSFINKEASFILNEHSRHVHGWHPCSLNLDLKGTRIFN